MIRPHECQKLARSHFWISSSRKSRYFLESCPNWTTGRNIWLGRKFCWKPNRWRSSLLIVTGPSSGTRFGACGIPKITTFFFFESFRRKSTLSFTSWRPTGVTFAISSVMNTLCLSSLSIKSFLTSSNVAIFSLSAPTLSLFCFLGITFSGVVFSLDGLDDELSLVRFWDFVFVNSPSQLYIPLIGIYTLPQTNPHLCVLPSRFRSSEQWRAMLLLWLTNSDN